MPIPGDTFKAKVAFSGEMAFLQTQGDDQQHQSNLENVETMKSSQHKERRAKNAGS